MDHSVNYLAKNTAHSWQLLLWPMAKKCGEESGLAEEDFLLRDVFIN